MRSPKALRLHYRIHRVGYLRCFVERSDLMWYEEVYVTSHMRRRGYAKWLFAQSIIDFSAKIEVDVLSGVPCLPKMFKQLGFRRNGLSERYEDCQTWHLDPHKRSARNRRKTGLLIPELWYVNERETSRFLWREKVYKLNRDGIT